jgi:hypothetical protein
VDRGPFGRGPFMRVDGHEGFEVLVGSLSQMACSTSLTVRHR